MPNGMSQQQMLDRIYTELVGLDGQSGLMKEHRELQDACKNFSESMVTKEACEETRKRAGDKKDKVLMRLKDVMLIAGMIATLLLGSGLLRK